MTICPKCGAELVLLYDGDDGHCENAKCKGWYCFLCDKWHPYKSCCLSAIEVFSVESQEDYDKWCKEHGIDILRMLRDSGYLVLEDLEGE